VVAILVPRKCARADVQEGAAGHHDAWLDEALGVAMSDEVGQSA